MLKLPQVVFVVGFVLCTIQPVAADPIVFPSRVAFDTAVLDIIIEGWDGYVAGTVFMDGATIDGIIYNPSNGDAIVTDAFLTSSRRHGLGATPDEFFVGSMTFGFVVPLDAFAIDINTRAGILDPRYTATTNAGDIVSSVLDPFPGSTTGQFIGFSTSLPFTSVTIEGPSAFGYTLDTLRYSPVPEPGTMLLLGIGLGGVVLRHYRAR
jgi:hypothetical protein